MARIEILQAGHCTSFACLARRHDPWSPVRFPATFGLIVPQGGGPVLFDTGYSRHVLPAMRRFPFWLYRHLLPVAPGVDAVDQLRQRGIAPEDVETVIVSHFHPDHIGGLRDFPKARFVCSRRAWDDVRGRRGFAALRRGFLVDLVPEDFAARAIFAEDLDYRLSIGADWVDLMPLEGHVPGMIGLRLCDDAGRPVLFAADAAWRRSVLEDGVGPHALAMAVHHDRVAYAETVATLARLRREMPGLRIILSHDPEVAC